MYWDKQIIVVELNKWWTDRVGMDYFENTKKVCYRYTDLKMHKYAIEFKNI